RSPRRRSADLRARLALERPRVVRVAGRDVGQGETEDAGPPGDLGRLPRGGVAGRAGAVHLVVGEGGVVDQEVRLPRHLDRAPRGPRVARVDDLPARARRPHDVLRPHDPAVHLDRLAAVQLAEQRPFRHAQLARTLRVEAAAALVLGEHVAQGTSAVLRAVRDEVVAVTLDALVRLQLVDLDAERHALDAEVHGIAEDRAAADRRPQRDGLLP